MSFLTNVFSARHMFIIDSTSLVSSPAFELINCTGKPTVVNKLVLFTIGLLRNDAQRNMTGIVEKKFKFKLANEKLITANRKLVQK